jgi:hypothetical protein
MLFSLFALIAIASAGRGGYDSSSDGSFDQKPGSTETNTYDVVFVGGGMGNVAAAYWLSDVMKRANRPVSIAVIEKNNYIGGNNFDVDLQMPPAGRYDGSFGPKLRGGIGALRTSQLASFWDRRLIAQLNLTMFWTPFRNNMDMRGVRRLCRNPMEKALEEPALGDVGQWYRFDVPSKRYVQLDPAEPAIAGDKVRNPGDAYAYGDFCNNRAPYVQPDDDERAVFRGFDQLVGDARDSPSDAAWLYLLQNTPHLTGNPYIDANDNWKFNYGGIHPFTGVECDTPGAPLCPYKQNANRDPKTTIELEFSLEASGGVKLNQNYSAHMVNDGVGFFGDQNNGHSTLRWLEYNLFEWNTNSFNGYLRGGRSELIDAMVKVAKSRGVQFFTNERIKTVNKATTSGIRYTMATTKRTVRARNYVGLGLEPFYLFKNKDQDPIVEYDGVDLGGDIITRLRATRQAKQPQQARAIKIVAQWPPGRRAWTWDLLDSTNGNYSLRTYGDSGSTSRVEIIDTPKHRCTNEVTVTYTDYLGRPQWQSLAEDAERTGNYTEFKLRIVEHMQTMFPEVAHSITPPIGLTYKMFDAAWSLGKMSYDDITSEEVARWGREPLGPAEYISMVAESYFPRRSGWADGAQQAAWEMVSRYSTLFGLVPQRNAVEAALLAFLRDKTGNVGDGSAFDSNGDISTFGYMPPAYTASQLDQDMILPNERWPKYGPYNVPGYDQDSCRPSRYGIQV